MSKLNSIILFIILGIIVGFLIYFFYPSPEINGSVVNIYFPNSIEDPDMFDCGKVFPVTRNIQDTQNIIFLTLNELLLGPTEQEVNQGYFTSINTGVEIQELVIEQGIAKVDLSEQLIHEIGGSCLVASIRSQISQTLVQFDEIDEVIISVNGEAEEILQP